MKPHKIILTAGFAMFSMFFGSGNLVFPLLIGTQTLSNYPNAILGFVLTAVIVPFLGLLGMILYSGNRDSYFATLGRIPTFTLTFLMLALMGPFGVIPRCITVAFGGITLLAPSFSSALFNALFCILCGLLIWKRNRIVDIIGLFLTPFKLGGIIFLILVGLWYGAEPTQSNLESFDSLKLGVSQGYQTMDLIAAFFFACTIFEYLGFRTEEGKQTTNKQLISYGVIASLIGASLLTLVYIGFIMLGAKYAPHLHGVPPESMLIVISQHALGHYAIPVVSLVLAVSCLATATILTTLFVDFLKTDISKDKLTRPQSIVITLAITFAMSLLGFQSICTIIGTILEWMYPFLIAYAVFKIVSKFKQRNTNQLLSALND